MKFIDLIKKRQSVRRYTNAPVDREIIERCIEAARFAPSACNGQPWKYVIVDDPVLREKIAKETFSTIAPFNKFSLQAPVIVVLVMEKTSLVSQFGGRVKNKDFYLIDIGITAEHFCLQAAEEGIGTCMLGWFNEKKIKEILGMPVKRSIGLLITMGYQDDKQRIKIRKEPDKIRSYNKY